MILTGGSVVSFYSGERNVSKDIDLVIVLFAKRPKIRKAMKELGFHQRGRHFEHPDSEYPVEFPGGPPSVGSESIGEVQEYEFQTGTLKILSPTDCVKDRLAAFSHWNDRQSLEQAIMVVQDQQIDLDEVERWSEAEGKSKEFHEIKKRLMNAIQ